LSINRDYPRATRTLVYLFLFVLLLGTFATAQERPALTMQWALGAPGSSVARVPKTLWLHDGSAILYNERLPKEQRTFERFDPATGKATSILDVPKALVSLKSFIASDNPETGLDWPEDFDVTGTKAAYIFGNDVYILDLPTATFTRATSTASEEKDLHFSPDGHLLAYVRDNDLYVYDLSGKKESRLTIDGNDHILNGTLTWVYWEEIFGRTDIGYWWSPDSKSIAYLQTDVTGVPVSTFVDFKPQEQRIIHQVYPKPGEKNPNVKVGIVGINSPATRWIEINDKPFEWLLRVDWLPDSQRVAVETLNRPQTELGAFSQKRTPASLTFMTTSTSLRTDNTFCGRPSAPASCISTATRWMALW
jgi:dipeptidyl-peptidase-4